MQGEVNPGFELNLAYVRSVVLWVHLNITPLDLGRLLIANPADFAHDVWGMFMTFDVDAMKLRDLFTPLFAAHQ
jgi:hypothetical protein